jgi:hypothetical protein
MERLNYQKNFVISKEKTAENLTKVQRLLTAMLRTAAPK